MFLSCVLIKAFQVAQMIYKTRRCDARLKMMFLRKALLRRPNAFKVLLGI
jgi:hypothetical protein